MSSRLAIYGIRIGGLDMRVHHVICAESLAVVDSPPHIIDICLHYQAMLSACECCGGTDKPCEACLEVGQ